MIEESKFKKVITDMNPGGNISSEEGALTCLYTALLPPNSDVKKGAFWYYQKIYNWDDLNLNLSVFR
jgi:hypothetical protein